MTHRLLMLAGGSLLLSSCVSFGAKAPPALLVLSADTQVANGTTRSGSPSEALVILSPETPRKLDTPRVPVQISESSIAYLKDGVWADKPAKLWQQLLSETISARSDLLVLSSIDTGGRDEYQLSGALLDFGIDAQRMEAVVTYDAVKLRDGKPVEKKRFSARKDVPVIEAGPAGEALNAAANELAVAVADWAASKPPAGPVAQSEKKTD